MCIALWDTVLFAYACRPIYFISVRACTAILQLECARLPVSLLLVILAVQKQSVIPFNIANWYIPLRIQHTTGGTPSGDRVKSSETKNKIKS